MEKRKELFKLRKEQMKLLIKKVVRDTLMKRERGEYRFSSTKFIMFNAWMLAVYMVIYDLYKEGFRYDVFVTLAGIALGVKLNDALANKIKTYKK